MKLEERVPQPAPATAAGRRPKLEIVDCDVHSKIPNPLLIEYLPEPWSTYYAGYGYRAPNEVSYFSTRPRGGGAARTDAFPPSGLPPGGDPAFTQKQLLDEWGTEKAIINPIDQLIMGNVPVELASHLCAAVNDWTLDAFIRFDPRFLGSICIPFEDAKLSVAEMERLGSTPGFVQALVNARTRDPFGNRKYWPVYEAAEALGMPVAAHVGGVGHNTMTGAGWPSYYFEDHAGFSQSFQAQVISLVAEGVFQRFPKLKFVIQESGIAWIAPLMWKLDRSWRRLRSEVPHLDRLPSEVIREHIWFTTQPIEEPEKPEYFMQLMDQMQMGERLMFSSDYPHWDFDAPDSALPREVPKELRDAIMAGNARALYGLPMPAGNGSHA